VLCGSGLDGSLRHPASSRTPDVRECSGRALSERGGIWRSGPFEIGDRLPAYTSGLRVRDGFIDGSTRDAIQCILSQTVAHGREGGDRVACWCAAPEAE